MAAVLTFLPRIREGTLSSTKWHLKKVESEYGWLTSLVTLEGFRDVEAVLSDMLRIELPWLLVNTRWLQKAAGSGKPVAHATAHHHPIHLGTLHVPSPELLLQHRSVQQVSEPICLPRKTRKALNKTRGLSAQNSLQDIISHGSVLAPGKLLRIWLVLYFVFVVVVVWGCSALV